VERLLQYVWRHRLYGAEGLTTEEGTPVEVIDPGLANADGGPDFFNAKIRMDGVTLAGNVELHVRASDWFRHHHDQDRAYDSVILHVVGESDAVVRRTTGEVIPQAVLNVPDKVRENAAWLLYRDSDIPCLPRLGEISPVSLTMWLGALQCERLERKVGDVLALLEHYGDDWNEVFYVLVSRSFGVGVNSVAFELLAKSLPWRCILHHRHSQAQVEALLLGQAGLEKGEEYSFLQRKFGLQPVEGSLFRNLRVRPGGFPRRRITQLASLWVKYDTLFSQFLEASSPAEVACRLQTEPPLGEVCLNSMLINAVAPILFAYGRLRGQKECADRAVGLLESLPPEKNRMVQQFTEAGFRVKNAYDSQGLIQLKREYCERRKCLFCRIGAELTSRNQRP
jgi:hypothetical protein